MVNKGVESDNQFIGSVEDNDNSTGNDVKLMNFRIHNGLSFALTNIYIHTNMEQCP